MRRYLLSGTLLLGPQAGGLLSRLRVGAFLISYIYVKKNGCHVASILFYRDGVLAMLLIVGVLETRYGGEARDAACGDVVLGGHDFYIVGQQGICR